MSDQTTDVEIMLSLSEMEEANRDCLTCGQSGPHIQLHVSGGAYSQVVAYCKNCFIRKAND